MNQRMSYLVIAHAMAVLFVGLIAGVFLIFALLEGVGLWPMPILDIQVPGSARGWQAAHVGGILNAVMIAVLVWVAKVVSPTEKGARWTGWILIITGWGNTLFYWAGNFSANRGLSVTDTPFGAGDIWGALAYLGGGAAMFALFVGVWILGLAALRKYRVSGTDM